MVSCCPLPNSVHHVKVTFAEGATKVRVCFTVLKSHNLKKPFSHRLVKIDLKIYYILELLLLYKNLVKNEKNSHTAAGLA